MKPYIKEILRYFIYFYLLLLASFILSEVWEWYILIYSLFMTIFFNVCLLVGAFIIYMIALLLEFLDFNKPDKRKF
jgi:hypothetical protein